jgi:hypothetical protein
MTLVLSRAQGPRPGDRGREGYVILDANQLVGRIYLIDSYKGVESWFWSVELTMSRRKSFGRAESLDEAKAAFKAEYEQWLVEQALSSVRGRHIPSIPATPGRTAAIDFTERARRYRSKAEEFRRLAAELPRSDGAQESYLVLAASYNKMVEDMEVLAGLRTARVIRDTA